MATSLFSHSQAWWRVVEKADWLPYGRQHPLSPTTPPPLEKKEKEKKKKISPPLPQKNILGLSSGGASPRKKNLPALSSEKYLRLELRWSEWRRKKILNSSPAEKNSHYILAGLPLPQKNILVLSSGGSSGEEKNLNHFSSRK